MACHLHVLHLPTITRHLQVSHILTMTGYLHVSQDHLHVSLCIIITGQLDFLRDIIALIKLSQLSG